MKKLAVSELQTKFSELTTRPFRSVSPLPSKQPIENVLKQVQIYEKEKAFLQAKISNLSLNRELDLTENIKNLNEKLTLLVKENLRLNTSPSHNLPPLTRNSMETEEDLQREIKYFQKNISQVEETIKAQSQKIHSDQVKFSQLASTFEGLKKNAPVSKQNNLRTKAGMLKKKLKIIKSSWKSNVLKMENQIKESENEQKSLVDQYTKLRSHIFKQDQQRRLLDMSHDDYRSMKREGLPISDTPDIYHPDVSFLYKPSVKALYST